MTLRLLALGATAATALFAGAANASLVTITAVRGVDITEPLITDFNSNPSGAITDLAAGFHFTQNNTLAFTRDGGLGLWSGVSAPPPADNGVAGAYYETVEANGSATLTSDQGLTSFQFYMGSPDEYNHLTINFANANLSAVALNGNAIWGGNPVGNGDQSLGYTVSYSFAAPVKSITFTSSGNSFEFDKLAGSVPEPTSWALMILGFGGAGAALRGKRGRRSAGATA
jgi:hypothetical protein